MYRKLFMNDCKSRPWNYVVLFLFMTLSVTITVSVVLMITQLFTSIDTMYKVAKPPHFLQMHKGEIDLDKLNEFNNSYSEVEHWQTVPMIDVYGDELHIKGHNETSFTLAECRIDISLVKQNQEYDVLLDENRNPIHIKSGHIGVPMILLNQYDIAVGDEITLTSGESKEKFIVSHYVYDGQMNSTLCSSTRFLISEEDFDRLYGKMGETEYLIEAYLTDSKLAATYQSAYEQSDLDLPKNGQAVTYTVIFLLSAMTDLITAMLFLLVGLLLIGIAFLCLRYTLFAEMEEEKKEIGTMKAMGIPKNGIRGLYLWKIRMIMSVSSVVGIVISFVLQDVFTERMSRTFGKQALGWNAYLLAVAAGALVYVFVILISKCILRMLQKVSVVDLLVREKGFSRNVKVRDGLNKSRNLSVNVLYGVREARNGYGMIFGLLLLTTLLILLPIRLITTMQNENFVTYMGRQVNDAFLEVEQGESIDERNRKVEGLLNQAVSDGEVVKYQCFKRVRLQALNTDGKYVGIHVDTGNGAGQGLQYTSGGSPKTEKEIVLSSLMADELSKKVGDKLQLVIDGGLANVTVCGIYQDVTSGGRTAKMVAKLANVCAEQYTYQLHFSEQVRKNQIIKNYRANLGKGYRIEDMKEFIGQTLGGVTLQLSVASRITFVIGIVLVILIVTLYLKLHLSQKATELAGKRAMGIAYEDIRKQELYPILIKGGIGIVAGMIITEFLGEKLISMMFSVLNLGITRIEFAPISMFKCIAIIATLLVTLCIVTILSCAGIKKMSYMDYLND